LYPGNVFSLKKTPEFIKPIETVLNQRGDNSAKGWSRAWKTALWARLRNGQRADTILKGYFTESWPQLFTAGGSTVLQVDGTLGMTAAISEMLVQSNEDVIDLLPALPQEWSEGEFNGVCTTGAFELDIKWAHHKLTSVTILSKQGQLCHVKTNGIVRVMTGNKNIKFKKFKDGTIQFLTRSGFSYILKPTTKS